MHAYNCICANVPAQIACIAALNEGLEAPKYMNEAYIERRDYLKAKLLSLGFELEAQPEGAFYIFPSIKRFTNNDFDFLCQCTGRGTCCDGARIFFHRHRKRLYSYFLCL